MIALLLWARVVFFVACGALVSLYVWIAYCSRRSE